MCQTLTHASRSIMGVTDDFVAWCEAKGADLSKVELRDATGSPVTRPVDLLLGAEHLGRVDAEIRGRGVFARTAMSKGDVVLSVPYAACIGTEGLRCGAGRDQPPPFEGASAAARLAWTLLSLRSDADWAPYLVALPHSLDTPTSGAWSRKEIAELQVADCVAAAAMTLARDARSVPMIVARRDGVDEKDAAADDRLSADWAWALSCVRSRAIELEYPNGATQSFLVPYVDMLNHAHVDPAVAWTSEDAHRRGHLNRDGPPDAAVNADDDSVAVEDEELKKDLGKVVLIAMRDIAEGEEITISYDEGAPTDPFVLHMGFIGGHNPGDSVEIFKNLRAAAAWYANAFRGENGEVVVDVAKANVVADQFVARERAINGGESHHARLGWGGRVSNALVDMFEAFCGQILPGEDPMDVATHAIRVRCEEMLASFPTTAGEDLEALESAGEEMSARQKLATEFRLRKKAILQHMLEGLGAADGAEKEGDAAKEGDEAKGEEKK